MRRIQLLCAFIVSLGCGACQSIDSEALDVEEGDQPPESPACTSGEPYAMSFQPPNFEVMPEHFGFENEFHLYSAHVVRLDFCVSDEEEVSLQAVHALVGGGGDSIPEFVSATVDRHAQVSGVTEALFDADLSSLDVRITSQQDGIDSVFIKGWQTPNGDVVTFSRYRGHENNPLVVATEIFEYMEERDEFPGTVIYGQLTEGDIFAPPPCRSQDRRLALDQGYLHLKFCISGSHDRAITYHFESIEILDPIISPELTIYQGDSLTLERFYQPRGQERQPPDGDKVLYINMTHHGLADEFHIKSRGVIYSIENTPRIGVSEFELEVHRPDSPVWSVPLNCSIVYQCERP